MLMREATQEMKDQWTETYQTYHPFLKPNRKRADELISYLRKHYPLKEMCDKKINQMIIDSAKEYAYAMNKTVGDQKFEVVAFIVENKADGKQLYNEQDPVFAGSRIIAGIEVQTGYFTVEGSSFLWDELFAYRGLDVYDLDNIYLVAEYVACLKRFGRLSEIGIET